MFDPHRVIDRATYREPSAPSAGIQFVIVNGSVVVPNGRIRQGGRPRSANSCRGDELTMAGACLCYPQERARSISG